MAADFLLKIDEIKGEAQDKTHKDTIAVDSFSWGISNPGSYAHGGGGGAGKANFQDMHFTAQVSKASANLALYCSSGKYIKKAVLYVRKQGEKPQEYYTVTLEDLIVSSYQSGDAAGGSSVPTDQFALNYAKVEFQYRPQKSDQTLDSAIEMKWDLKGNAKS